MTQDPLMTYAHVWIIKEAAEMAKSADPKAIRDAVAKLDLKSGPAASTLARGGSSTTRRGRPVGTAPIIAAVAERRAVHRRAGGVRHQDTNLARRQVAASCRSATSRNTW